MMVFFRCVSDGVVKFSISGAMGKVYLFYGYVGDKHKGFTTSFN